MFQTLYACFLCGNIMNERANIMLQVYNVTYMSIITNN